MKSIEYVVERSLWGDSDMCVIDVGASGGIYKRWSVFGDRLTAVGFDPLIQEVNRLNELETRTKVRYEAAAVGCHDFDRLFPPSVRHDEIASRFNQPFHRSSALAAHRIVQKDYVREVFNSGAPVEYTSRVITLDDFLASSPEIRPDFLKVDTDGHDYQVLLGTARTLESGALLGIAVEVQFHGAVHEFANGFSNIDRFLRSRGFSLFDLPAQRYSRADLPAPFVSSIPAQTVTGQVGFAEAVYFRDLAHPAYEQMFGVAPTRERLVKLLCLYVLFGFNDCAVELLVSSDMLIGLPERAALLDALTPRTFGDRSYQAYMERFNAEPLAWLPQNVGHGQKGSTALREENTRLHAAVETLKARVRGLKDEREELRERLRKREERIEAMKKKPT